MSGQDVVLVIFASNRAVVVNSSKIEVLKSKRTITQMISNNGCRVVRRQGKGVLELLAAVFPTASEKTILECADNNKPLTFVFYKMVLEKLQEAAIHTVNGNGAGNKLRGVKV